MIGLKTFLKGTSDPKANMPGCANYDIHYGGCLFKKKCLVEEGKRCNYFEKAVLPTAGQLKYGHKIIDEYHKLCNLKLPIGINVTKAKFCECGATIPSGHRFCSKCKEKKRRATYRRYKRKYRSNQCPTVMQNSAL